MRYPYALLALLIMGSSSAQTAIQIAIANKITYTARTVPCQPVPGAGDLKGAVCGESNGDPAMSTTPNPDFPMEYRQWIEIAPSTYFNIWNSSVAKHPVYLSVSSKPGYVTQVAVASAGATLPVTVTRRSGSLTPGNEARAAGATRGAGYTDARYVQKFAVVQQTGKIVKVSLGQQTLALTLGQKAARLNGRSVTLQGAPFLLNGQVYYPVGLFKLLGCTVTPLMSEARVANAMDVTCLVGNQRRNGMVENWMF
ncbi:hypothetical protein GCM10008959_31600 [Deinococcus seoulensis]|uniref:Copper amine oxidase-like N-terminal domain-containing protein n=1 Tax=Deinococcus seoulensis TaxID=1837379 RepID=A0ABQ2RVU7_9DEIO|nr:stalk domain-containing protein [Deinococcus seoulensis]GGR67107.1 hypothetical protein GCM10008959_31600 [Deinococcus seoulensis]